MKRLLLEIMVLSFVCSTAYTASMQASITLSPDYQGEGTELIISWDAIPGESYNVDAATELGGTWSQLNAEPMLAQSDVESYSDQTTDPVKFYRVWKVDTEPPEVAYLYPRAGGIAVGRQEVLSIHLTDESDIDLNSVAFSIGSSPAIGVDDPRLSYSEGVLTYTPDAGEYLGDYGETIVASLSVSDTFGHRLEDYTWSLNLELETILADNVFVIDDASHLTLVSAVGNNYTFSYTGDSPGLSEGSIVVSTDQGNPYKQKAFWVTDHPESHTVDVSSFPVPLAALLQQGSVRSRFSVLEEPDTSPPTEPLSAKPLNGNRISLDGQKIYETDNFVIEVTSGYVEFVPECAVTGDFEGTSLKSFEIEMTGTVNFKMVVKATATIEGKYENEKTLKTIRKFHVQLIGLVPVWEEVVLDFNVGFSADAKAEGWVTAGFECSKSITLGATMRGGNCSKYCTQSGIFTPVKPKWQIDGGINVEAYVEPKFTVYLESVAGPSVNLKPYLALDGHFQMNPEGYDWVLYAGVTSDLALEVRGWDDSWGQLPTWKLLDFKKNLAQGEYPSGSVPPEQEWSETFGGSDEEMGFCIQETTDGGFIVAGYTQSFGPNDVYLVKTRSKEEWEKTFGGIRDERAACVQETSDKGFIVAGWTGSYGEGRSDVYLIKTDADGDEQWSKTYGGDGFDYGHYVQQTSDGGYIVVGETTSFGAGYLDVYLIKTDADGNEKWSKTHGGDKDDYGYSVQRTSDGGYIVAGITESFGEGRSDVYLIKTYENGNEEWSKTFGGDNYDYGYYAQQTSDGGYIVAARTSSFGEGSFDAYLIKTYANGNEQWSKTFGGGSSDSARCVQQTPDGGYVLVGYTQSFGEGGGDVYLIKTDRYGNKQWDKTFGGTEYEYGYSVQRTADGGYVVAGVTGSSGVGSYDVYVVKTK